MQIETQSQRSSVTSSLLAARSRQLLDRVSLGIGLIFIAMTIGNALCGLYELAFMALAVSSGLFAIRNINTRGHHKTAAILLILGSNAIIFKCACMFGKRYLFQNLFFPSVTLPVLVCGELGALYVMLGCFVPISLYTILRHADYAPMGTTLHTAATYWKPESAAGMCFGFCFFIAFEFYRITRKAEEELRQEQNKLLAASKFSALGEMAGGIAHEINNPLSNILLLSAHIRSLASAPEIRQEGLLKAADNIQNTVKRISAIIRSLSSFARNTDRDPMARVSVAKVIHESCGLCLDKFANNGVELRVSAGAGNAIVECNAVQVSQVLLNLLNNAYDAVQSSPQRWVKLEAIDRHDLIEFAVMDSGPGIRRDIRDRLFEPFFTTKEAGRGTGLGLSVSSNIARAHHGELALDPYSPYTRFRLWLPKEQPRPARFAVGLEPSQRLI